MAIGQSDGSIILNTKVDTGGISKGFSNISAGAKKAASTVGKAFLAIGVAATAATVAITKASVDAFAEYEQLVGGVETLFKNSSKKVVEYANEAYRTAGVSANEYMSIVTSFSASLLQSLGGDTDKAADVANQALIDMSDNANKMGTSMEMIQNAYQGFAKQNYTMLDNLKLGYGGTKTEMERLLRDAQALTGVKYDISNLADVYSAIHAIQENLGIAGTTAIEAEKTISGSAKMMKASWQNVLSAVAGGVDLDKAINNLVYSASKYFENIVPVIERSLQGIGQLIERVAPMLVQTVARSLISAIPSLLEAVYQMIIGLAKGVYQGIVDLFSGEAQKTVEAQVDSIRQSTENQNELTDAIKETQKAQKGALAGFDEINTLGKESAFDAEGLIGGSIGGNNGEEISLGIDTEKSEKQMSSFFKSLAKKIETYLKPITDSLGRLFDPIKDSFKKIDFEGMKNDLAEWGQDLSENVISLVASGIDSLAASFVSLEGSISSFWNDTLKPIVDQLGVWINDIIEETEGAFKYFSEKVEEYKVEIEGFVSGISAILQVIWAVISPIIDSIFSGIGQKLQTTIDFIFSVIQVIGNFFDFFKNIFSGIKALIEGDTDAAISYFSEALGNFVNVFVGIANGIISVFNNLWSLVFDSVKGALNSIGGIVSEVGKFLGQDWGWNLEGNAPLIPLIPKYVPKLARGTVVPPNREFMAVLGDNKKEPEIVSPLSTMKQAVAEVIAQMNANGSSFNGIIEVPVIIDGREIARAVRSAEQDMGSQTVWGGFVNAY